MFRVTRAVVAIAFGLLPLAAQADVTGPAGGSQPQTTVQPSLGLNYLVRTDGLFSKIGEVTLFGGNFSPVGWLPADGRSLQISQYSLLFAVIGTTYGGDGQTTFALPDLRGRTAIGSGSGPGLTPQVLGSLTGTESVTLTAAQLPVHAHTLPASGATDPAGGGQPYSNMQPSLALNYMIPLQGVFPSRDGPGFIGIEPLLGSLELTTRSVAPQGYALAQGQLLAINQNQALFSILGTTYGGDGRTTFALPDLRGRAAIGADSVFDLGQSTGAESVSLTLAQMPAHDHTLPPSSDFTGLTGGGLPQTNMQPSLGLNYIIALEGIFPPRGDGSGLGGFDQGPFIGEIGLFAGTFAPGGWALAAGQLLPISQYTALFSLLGTTFGGDGRTTFALPDLRGALAVGEGQGPGLSLWSLGQRTGVEALTLTQAQMPSHTHTYAVAATVPEPATLVLMAVALAALGFARRRGAA